MPKTIFTGQHAVLVEVLREARSTAGLTQVELAHRLGKDQSIISLIESSQRRIDVVEFIEISRAFGVAPRDLFATLMDRIDQNAAE